MDQPPRAYGVRLPDYDHDLGARLEVLFNGQVVTDVIEYDCDKGHLLRYNTDEQGNVRLDRLRDAAETAVLTGNVEVRFKA